MAQKRNARGQFTKISKARTGRPRGSSINLASAGETGLKRSQGIISEEFLTDLQGPRAAEIFKEMRENDPIIGAMFFGIEMFQRQVEWFVDSFADSEEHEEKAKFLRECKDDMSHTWPDFIAEVMSMMEHGWSWFEELYKRRLGERPGTRQGRKLPTSKYSDNKIGWRKFDIRSQDSLDRWDFDESDGGLRGMYQRPAPNYEEKYVPLAKSLLFRTTTKKNNPEGRSVLRNAYRPYYFKKRMEEHEGIGVERDLAGLPFAEVPAEMMGPNATEADKATLASIVDLVKNVRRDEQEGVVWPQQWNEAGQPMLTFKLMASGGSRVFDTDKIISRYESRIAMTSMMDFLLLGNDNSNASIGGMANKSGMFQSALGVWLDMIQDVLNNYAVPRLFRLNGDYSGEYPKFRHDEVQKPSLADLATFVAALTGAGAQLFPDVELENHFRRMAQLPLRELDASIMTKEDELRESKMEAAIQGAKFAMDNPGGAPPVSANSKDPTSRPGAPTKTTGKVKSKLPPQQRRRTAAVNAAENVRVTKRNGKRVLVRRAS